MSQYLIRGGNKISGTVHPSGNKNEALPALMACLLTDQPVTLMRLPKILDVLTVCSILEELGVTVTWHGEDSATLNASGLHSYQPNHALCAKVRASILLIGPLLARMGRVELAVPGGDVIGARRIDTHFEGAKALGADLEFGSPIRGSVRRIVGTDIYLDEPSVTGTENLLLMAVLGEGTTVLHNAACEPHVSGLANLLVGMGANISGIGSNRLTIHGVKSLGGCTHEIGPDFMEIGSFICLGAIGGGKVRIEGTEPDDLRFVLKTFGRLGIHPEIEGNVITVDGSKPLSIAQDLGGRVGTIYSGPWPAFPTDLMSVTIVAATQATGTAIFFEKMFEGRMFFTDKLMSMGANIVLCDPHRVVINGKSKLFGAHLSSPDVRAGMAMVMAAAIAEGQSVIDNIYQIERGYFNIGTKLAGLGVDIQRSE